MGKLSILYESYFTADIFSSAIKCTNPKNLYILPLFTTDQIWHMQLSWLEKLVHAHQTIRDFAWGNLFVGKLAGLTTITWWWYKTKHQTLVTTLHGEPSTCGSRQKISPQKSTQTIKCVRMSWITGINCMIPILFEPSFYLTFTERCNGYLTIW